MLLLVSLLILPLLLLRLFLVNPSKRHLARANHPNRLDSRGHKGRHHNHKPQLPNNLNSLRAIIVLVLPAEEATRSRPLLHPWKPLNALWVIYALAVPMEEHVVVDVVTIRVVEVGSLINKRLNKLKFQRLILISRV